MRTSFKTLESRLDYNSPPMRLWQKSKKYGIWNPNDIDLSQDAADFKNLAENEKEYFRQILGQFQAGEEAVTLDLLPLIMAVAKEGRLEEEIFLTSFLWEEAKHVDGFNRIFVEVVGDPGDLSRFMFPSYKKIFYDLLPNALDVLKDDPSPVNQAVASVTYNMIVEGVLAETGYHSFYEVLNNFNIMPGIKEFVGKLKQDESRHIAYGIFLLSRLIAENGDEVWNAFEKQMQILMEPAVSLVQEGYDYFGDNVPFGLKSDQFTGYAMDQFQKRFARIQRARTQTLDEIYKIAEAEVAA